MKNMMEIDYSVIIRTTGKAGEKYRKLLDSISGLKPQPKEVIVVLPEGYELPEDQIGWETFYFCKKGMVIQRLTGLEMCKTKYALFADDDISFKDTFVQKLYQALDNGKYGFSIGPLVNFFPQTKAQILVSAIMGAAVPTVFRKNYYNYILRTAGYSYNSKIHASRNYETQSAPWTCFFADAEKMRSLHLEEEIWLDKNGYSAHDDTTMFYKGWLCGAKTIVCTDAEYEHLDARTSFRNNRSPVLYSMNFNTVVFWHRFIYKQQKNIILKMFSKICILYRFFWVFVFDLLDVLRKRMKITDMNVRMKGFFDAWNYIKTEEYLNLPVVR